MKSLFNALNNKILVLDGAMGTMIQKYNLDEKDYRGERFKNFNEIYFSLNTVAKFLNFISHIYIITDDQQLNLRKIDKSIHSKIRMVNHTDIIPKKYLPVFNSELIQPFIHKIPKLSENVLCDLPHCIIVVDFALF